MFLTNKRQSEIIRMLLENNHSLTVQSMSQIFEVSSRTILYDMKKVKSYFDSYGIHMMFSRKTGYGIHKEDLQKLHEIYTLQGEIEELSVEERNWMIIIKLLEYHSRTYQSLADDLKVSRQTVINNFKETEKIANSLNLKIVKEKGKGLLLKGSEFDFRNAFNNLLFSRHLNQEILNRLHFCYCEPNITIAKQIISHVEKRLNIHFLEITLLEIEICFGLYQISKGRTFDDNDLNNQLMITESYPMFKAYYETLDLLPISYIEKIYITSLLMGAKIKNNSNALDTSEESVSIANYLMEKLEILHPLKNDEKEKFIKGLTSHLSVAIYRIKNKIPIGNELLEQIKIMIPLIYEYTKVQLLECERIYGLNFDENEMAYIAMYIASAYESSLKIKLVINILVVCSYGNTTSTILRSRLDQNFSDCKLFGPISKEELSKFEKINEIDLIVTTAELNLSTKQRIMVNPLLNVDDLDKIRSAISQLSYAKMCNEFLRKYRTTRDPDEITIGNLMDDNCVQIIESCDTWEHAIKLAANPLLVNQKIEERYIHKMIDAVYQLGAYMVLIPETAFVHAGSEDGVIDNCMALLILKKPIVFGAQNAKIVRNIVVIGNKDKETTLMLDLVDILSKESNRRILASDGITKEIVINLHSV